MQTINATQAAATFTPTSSSAIARAWQTGTLLQALVKRIAPEGLVTLRVGNTLLTGKSPIPLQLGQTLQLQVVEAGAKPVLKIIHNTPSGNSDAQQITEALRASLPRQAPLPQLLTRLASLAQSQTEAGAGLTRPLLEQIAQLINRLTQSGDTFHGAGLRRALADSGVLLEAKLASASNRPAQFSSDIKAGLLQLRAALVATLPGALAESPAQHGATLPPLRGAPLIPQASVSAHSGAGTPTPPTATQLLGLIDAALARIQLSQIASLPITEDKKPAWMFELPVRHGELINVFQVRIEAPNPDQRHSNAVHTKNLPWCIELAFDLGQLGPMHARISAQQAHVSVSLWAVRNETVSLFNQQIEILRSNLQHDGLEVDNLVCLSGTPPTVGGSDHASHRLLSVQA